LKPLDRLLAVFRGEKPDLMPWFADMIYWYTAHYYKGTLPEKYKGPLNSSMVGNKGYMQLCKDLGCGTYGGLLSLPADIDYGNVKVSVDYEGQSSGREKIQSSDWSHERATKDQLTVRYTKYESPIGTLTSVDRYSADACTWVCVKHAVGNVEELKILRYIYKQIRYKPNYSIQHKQLEEWGGYGAVSSFPLRTPFARLIVEWCGVANTFKFLLRKKEDLEETLETMSQADDVVYDIVADAPAPLILFGDNITSEIVSPPIFKKYYGPYYKRRVGKLHAKGKYAWVHIDGTLRGVLPLVEETGVDAAESLTPLPIGDVSVEDLRKIAGSRLILWGGIPAALFSPLYPDEELVSIVRKVIECYKEDGRFIIGSSDQPPPDSNLKRIKTVSELVEKYGSYT